MLDAVLRRRLRVDAQFGHGHKLAHERSVAHGAVVEVGHAAAREHERVLGIVARHTLRLLEHANRRVVFACFLLVGVHVRETGARQAQHALAVRFNLAGERGETARQAIGNRVLVLVVHHVLVDGRLSVVVVDVRQHLVPRRTAHLLRPVLTRGIGALEERNLIRVRIEAVLLSQMLCGRLRHLVRRDERVHGLA